MKKNICIYLLFILLNINLLKATDEIIPLSGRYTNNMIILNWENISNVTKIMLFRKEQDASLYILTNFQCRTTIFTDRMITSPIQYYYQITMDDPIKNKTYNSPIIKVEYYKKQINISLSHDKLLKIKYSAEISNNTMIKIINQFGQIIALYNLESPKGGLQEFSWDLRDLYGIPVSTGNYIILIKTNLNYQTNNILITP